MRTLPTHRRFARIAFTAGLLAFGGFSARAYAIDPPYQAEMERLIEVLGSLYFLQPLCEAGQEDWRAEASDLIALDQPVDERRQRLVGAFNAGYEAYARTYRSCTPSAHEAMERLLIEAEHAARELNADFTE